MMSPKKSKLKIERRKPGLIITPPPARPVDDSVFNPFREAKEAERETTTPTEPSERTPPTPPTSRTPPTLRTSPTPSTSIAPARDFTRVANSIVREAVAGGYFNGKSKQLYDCLYTLTRGAVVPKRSISIPKPELMKRSGIGSERTLLKNVAHLKGIGLIEVNYTDGKHGGNEYTVHLPEEIGLRAHPTPRTPPTPPTSDTPRHAPTELPSLPPVESGVGGVGLEPLDSTTSAPYQTLIPDKERSDDEASPRRLRAVERELTGKNSGDAAQWDELFDVLAAELRIAAGRTTVSSVPAFLAEHLRRRLWKLDKKQAQAEGRELPDQTAPAPSTRPRADCPDCGGSGWWYPDGTERGVMKCAHKNAPRMNQDVPPPD
jgi:hypothetical protein